MTADPDKVIALSPGDEACLWSLLEAAWIRPGPGVARARQALVVRSAGSPADTAVITGALPDFLDALRGLCRELSAGELVALDRVVERKLWEIDRADLHAVIGGSDDGFLCARGFTVAMGREFHRRVADDPRMGAPWAECGENVLFLRSPAPRTIRDLSRDAVRHLPRVGPEPGRLARLVTTRRWHIAYGTAVRSAFSTTCLR